MLQTEVLIVGGGPAGSACAWQLKQHNVDFLLLDKVAFPRPKTCAGWITPRVLRDLQLDPASYPGSFTTFRNFKIEFKRLRFSIPTRQYAIRRIELDDWLIRRVSEKVVTHNVVDIVEESGRYIVDGEYSARYLIGAGGTHCPVKRIFFHSDDPSASGILIIAEEEEFVYPHVSENCHLWYFQNGLPGYAWYFPKANGLINVGIGGDSAALKAHHDNLNRHWNLLVEKLDKAGLVHGHEFKPAGHSYSLRAKSPVLRVGNALLVGDALGMATMDMGEGIGPSVQSGINAAKAIISGTPYTLAGIARYSIPALLGLRR